MLKIWGRISSINVRKLVFTAQLLALPFERVDAGASFGITKTPDYLARNPNALVPTLEDGDFTLWESNVIVRYLCAKHDTGGLYPQDLRQRFDAERWMDWQQTTLNGAGREAFLQLFRTPEAQRNAQAIAGSVACEMHRWWGLPLGHPPHPHLRRWYDGLAKLPAARGALDVSLG